MGDRVVSKTDHRSCPLELAFYNTEPFPDFGQEILKLTYM